MNGARFFLIALCCFLLAACDLRPLTEELTAAASLPNNEEPTDTDTATVDEQDAAPAEKKAQKAQKADASGAGGADQQRGAVAGAPPPPDIDGVSFDGPVTISKGGTYRGNWQSDDPDVAAVTIDTTEPVTIAGSNIRSRGHLIASNTRAADVTVVNNVAEGLNPQRSGQEKGRFVTLHRARRAVIAGNDVSSTAGIEFVEYGGSGSGDQTFKVLANRVRNIDGRASSGDGMSNDDGAAELRQFVQLNRVTDVPGIEVAWNEVHNEPGKSRVEDNVSVWISSGTAGSPIDIHDNYIDGAYPAKPASDSYSGGGIMAGDGSEGGAPAHVVVRRNRVMNTTNYGIAISSGRNMTLKNNRVLSTGRLPSGEPIAAQNVGAYVWNMLGVDFGDNSATGNVVGWEKPSEGRNDYWMPDATQASGNASFSGAVTDAVIAKEYAAWQQDAQAAGVTVGVGD